MHDPKANRWGRIYETMTGVTSPGHHHEQPHGAMPESVTAGHEPDRFDVKGILMVPGLVVVVTFLAYLIVSGLFSWAEVGKPLLNPTMNPLAVADGSKSFNDRVERISSTDPGAKFHQPRLEGLKAVDTRRPGVSQPDPVSYRSAPPTDKNNTYEITPQDLYPQKFVDPQTGERLLDEYKWLNKENHIARIPVDEAIKLLTGELKSLLPAKPDGTAPYGTRDKPKASNGGHALTAEAPKKPAESKGN